MGAPQLHGMERPSAGRTSRTVNDNEILIHLCSRTGGWEPSLFRYLSHSLPPEQVLSELTGLKLSVGWCWEQYDRAGHRDETEEFKGEVKERLHDEKVASADETGARCGGRNAWIHTVSTPELTLPRASLKRCVEGMKEGGFLDLYGHILVHDCLGSYWTMNKPENRARAKPGAPAPDPAGEGRTAPASAEADAPAPAPAGEDCTEAASEGAGAGAAPTPMRCAASTSAGSSAGPASTDTARRKAGRTGLWNSSASSGRSTA